MHELGDNLAAVHRAAPNACAESGHTCDNPRDLMSRFNVRFGFYDADTESGRQLLREFRADSAELPVVVIRYGGRRTALANPSNLEIAEAFGLMRPVPAEELFDVAVVGAGPAGLAAAVSPLCPPPMMIAS